MKVSTYKGRYVQNRELMFWFRGNFHTICVEHIHVDKRFLRNEFKLYRELRLHLRICLLGHRLTISWL